MAIQTRVNLRNAFTQGRRPKQQEFWDWLDSFYHKTEDVIKTGGWQFRSFFKDLRAEGKAITTGGFSIIEIPPGVTKIKKIRVTGRGTGFPFNITTSLVYACDKLIPALNGVASTGNPFPLNFFLYPIMGLGSNPAASFVINSPVAAFGQTFDFATIPKDVTMDFTEARLLMLTIVTTGTFGANDYVYYGLEYE